MGDISSSPTKIHEKNNIRQIYVLFFYSNNIGGEHLHAHRYVSRLSLFNNLIG